MNSTTLWSQKIIIIKARVILNYFKKYFACGKHETNTNCCKILAKHLKHVQDVLPNGKMTSEKVFLF